MEKKTPHHATNTLGIWKGRKLVMVYSPVNRCHLSDWSPVSVTELFEKKDRKVCEPFDTWNHGINLILCMQWSSLEYIFIGKFWRLLTHQYILCRKGSTRLNGTGNKFSALFGLKRNFVNNWGYSMRQGKINFHITENISIGLGNLYCVSLWWRSCIKCTGTGYLSVSEIL